MAKKSTKKPAVKRMALTTRTTAVVKQPLIRELESPRLGALSMGCGSQVGAYVAATTFTRPTKELQKPRKRR